jgi:uncharacterized iron-regulated membrane protein
VAWVGVAALLGLLVCGITALYDLWRRRKQRKLPPGEVLPPSWWTGRHTALVVGGGVVLIAVVVGALILIFGSGSTTSPAKLVATPTTAPTTSTSSASTSTTLGPARPPQQVRVDVLNASGVPRVATLRSAQLTSLGYRVTSTGNALVPQKGTVVECKDGFAAEAAALARAVGAGALVQGFPVTPPPGSANADCVVLLGQ